MAGQHLALSPKGPTRLEIINLQWSQSEKLCDFSLAVYSSLGRRTKELEVWIDLEFEFHMMDKQMEK